MQKPGTIEISEYSGIFLEYPWRPESMWFSSVLGGYGMGTLAKNGSSAGNKYQH